MKNVIYELAKQAGFDAELMRRNADRGNPSIAETFAELLLAYSARQLHAWGYIDEYGEVQKFENQSAHKRDAYSSFQLLYTTPQQRTWVGLTDREKAVIVKMLWKNNFFVALEAVEAKLKEKNT